MKNPPILISVLGFFAALAGLGFLFFGLRVLGFDWFGAARRPPGLRARRALGLARGRDGHRLARWRRSASGRSSRGPASSRMIIAGFALFEAVLAFFQFPGSGVGFAMAIMPAADPVVPEHG